MTIDIPPGQKHDPNRKSYLANLFVAGLQYYDALEVWAELKIGTKLTLEPEPTNPYDRHAIRVLHNGRMLGYLPRNENRHMAKLLNAGWNPYELLVQGLYEQQPMNERLEVCIRVLPFGA
jgi:hypothetical protein